MNEYLVIVETEGDGEVTRDLIEYNAANPSEAQDFAFAELENNQRIISVWQRMW